MIAVTFALPQESKDFCHELSHPAKTLASALPILLGNLGRHEIAVCHTGIGGDSAQQQLRALVKLHRPRGLISAGFAGGLDPTLRIGDLVVATNFSDSRLLSVTRRLCDECDTNCYFGTLSTQPRVAETTDSKLFLRRRTRASAVDMETETIAATCKSYSIPMLSVRAISDIAADSLPVPFPVWFDAKKQKPRVCALLRFLASHPSHIRPFVQFVSGIHIARARLTRYLLQLIARL